MWSGMGRKLLKSALVVGCMATIAGVVSAQNIGPSTTTEPYVLPSVAGVTTTSILTVGDPIDGYPLVGIPDGLGAFKIHGGKFTLLMNHEFGSTQGAVHAHGSAGAFVSRWKIKRNTLEVLKGEDQTQSPNDVYSWDPVNGQYVQGTVAWDRLCSADLPARSALFHGHKGTEERIYLNGEETRPPFSPVYGSAWARIATGPNKGQTWELPRLGQMSFENVVASPYSKWKTVVVLLDDSSASTSPLDPLNNPPSELYVYVDTKTKHGNDIERAGLTNGTLYGMKVAVNGTAITEESNADGLGSGGVFIDSGTFSLHNLGDVSNKTGIQLQDDSIAAGIFRMQRVEDGAWDPRRSHKSDFYFVTTASFSTNSRLWRLRFNDIEHPENGGTIEILVRGDEGHKMFDNMTIDRCGRILIQEDVGNNARLGKIWMYDIGTGLPIIEVAAHNPKFFMAGMPNFLTADEESSGIIAAGRILGRGWFLLDTQAHFANGPVLVEGGQLLAMRVDPSIGSGCDQEDDDQNDDDEGGLCNREHR